MSWLDDNQDYDWNEMESERAEPEPHRCGEGHSIAKYSPKNDSYFIGCYLWPKCKYTRQPFYPEDDMKISRLEGIRAVTRGRK